MSETEQVEVPECVTLWICCHCRTPRTVGLSVCERCHKRLYDKVEYVRAPQGDAHPIIDVAEPHDFIQIKGSDRCGLRGCVLGVMEHAWIPPWPPSPVTAPVSTGELLCACRTFNLDPGVRAFLDSCDFVHTAVFCSDEKLAAATSTTPVDGEQADDFFCENCETHFTDKPHATADGCWLCDPCWRGLNEGTA